MQPDSLRPVSHRRYYLDRRMNLYRCWRCHEILDSTDSDIALALIRSLEEEIHGRPLNEQELEILRNCLDLDPEDMADIHECECFMQPAH